MLLSCAVPNTRKGWRCLIGSQLSLYLSLLLKRHSTIILTLIMASVKYVILQFFSEYLIFVHTKDTMIVDVKLSTIKKKGHQILQLFGICKLYDSASIIIRHDYLLWLFKLWLVNRFIKLSKGYLIFLPGISFF